MSAWLPTVFVGLLTIHAMVNSRLLPRPAARPSTVEQSVAVLLPVRDEAHRVRPCVQSLLAQQGVPDLRVLVLDDGSTDGTADVVRSAAAGDPRLTVLVGQSPPPGWLGKPYACHQLAAHAAAAEVLVFVDADVVLAPHAIAAAVGLLPGRELLSPYPRIVAVGPGGRLVQPLLQWSWLTFLPLRAMERSSRPSLAAAGGQFLVVTRSGYQRAGGHAGVRDQVLDDVALARAVKRSGGRIALADGSSLAACRMYDSWASLVDGYTKSLWAAFGPPVAALWVGLALLLLYVLPLGLVFAGLPLAGLAGYLLGVLGRIATGRATGARVWPDALLHPVSVLLFVWLLGRSYRRGRSVRWKGRPVTTVDS
jgi:glycosyltransferase involved in cell wall biosynthesis